MIKQRIMRNLIQGHFTSVIFNQVFCMFCAYTRPRYQMSIYRTIGPLVLFAGVFFSLFVFLGS